MSAIGGGWSSGADFSKGAIGDLDRVREYRCLGSGVHIVSHSGSLKPRIMLSQNSNGWPPSCGITVMLPIIGVGSACPSRNPLTRTSFCKDVYDGGGGCEVGGG